MGDVGGGWPGTMADVAYNAIFISDLARPDNDLPSKLKAQLTSVGLGIMSEAQRITLGLSRDLPSLAEICGIVHDGLA